MSDSIAIPAVTTQPIAPVEGKSPKAPAVTPEGAAKTPVAGSPVAISTTPDAGKKAPITPDVAGTVAGATPTKEQGKKLYMMA